MPSLRREEFILDVRRSARTLLKPQVQADSALVDTDAVARVLQRAALWLTPKVVEHYDPDDFASWSSEQQDKLRLAVDGFRAIVSQVPSDQPPTVELFRQGAERLRALIDVLGGMVLEEWLHAIDALEQQVETWAAEAEWRTRRVNKKMNESLIGAYEAPQLLIFAEPHLYVLDPIARFVPGAQGSFDFAVQPSYHTTSLYRDDDGLWYVHSEQSNGAANGQRTKWNLDSFRQCIDQLRALV